MLLCGRGESALGLSSLSVLGVLSKAGVELVSFLAVSWTPALCCGSAVVCVAPVRSTSLAASSKLAGRTSGCAPILGFPACFLARSSLGHLQTSSLEGKGSLCVISAVFFHRISKMSLPDFLTWKSTCTFTALTKTGRPVG